MCRPVSITTATDSELVRKLHHRAYTAHYKRQIREEMADRVRKYCKKTYPQLEVRCT